MLYKFKILLVLFLLFNKKYDQHESSLIFYLYVIVNVCSMVGLCFDKCCACFVQRLLPRSNACYTGMIHVSSYALLRMAVELR